MKKYLEERKIHLKKCEFDYFEKQYEQPNGSPLIEVYRGFSNEFHARRDELETLEKFLNGLPDKRTELLRFSKFLQDRHWFDDCSDDYYEILVNEFENLSDSSERIEP